NVKRCTQIPNPTGIEAAATWPASFCHQASPRKSSIAPTVVATAAPSSRPRVSRERSRNASAGTKIPKKSASPPSRGTARTLRRRAPGSSTTPSIRAIPPTAGVSRITIPQAATAPQMTSRWSVSVSHMSLGPVEPVAGVAEAGDDVAALVQLAVDGGGDDPHVRVFALQVLDPFGRGDQADERDRAGARALDCGNRGRAGAAGGKHRVEHDRVALA